MGENSMLLNAIMEAVNYKDFVGNIRKRSPLYPKFILDGEGSMNENVVVYISAMVMFEHEGKRYLRHHLETIIFGIVDENKDINPLLLLFHKACVDTMRYGKPMNVETAFGRIYDEEIPKDIADVVNWMVKTKEEKHEHQGDTKDKPGENRRITGATEV